MRVVFDSVAQFTNGDPLGSDVAEDSRRLLVPMASVTDMHLAAISTNMVAIVICTALATVVVIIPLLATFAVGSRTHNSNHILWILSSNAGHILGKLRAHEHDGLQHESCNTELRRR